jgi:biopolymer transport protein ExbD
MLVLLIIFMVAAPLATVSVEVKLPPAVAKAAPNPPKPVYISIQKSGDIYIGDAKSTVATLGRTWSTTSGSGIRPRSGSSSGPTSRPATGFHAGDEHAPG